MIERIDNDTPPEIQRLCLFPYIYFSRQFGSTATDHFQNSILDVACGNAFQKDILKQNFHTVKLGDAVAEKGIIQTDVTNLKEFKDNEVDWIFCFETIEHVLDHKAVVNSLKRVAKRGIVIGSVNKEGPDYINGIEIFKGDKNPYHLKELDTKTFQELDTDMTLLHSKFENGYMVMRTGLSKEGLCNYGIIIM